MEFAFRYVPEGHSYFLAHIKYNISHLRVETQHWEADLSIADHPERRNWGEYRTERDKKKLVLSAASGLILTVSAAAAEALLIADVEAKIVSMCMQQKIAEATFCSA